MVISGKQKKINSIILAAYLLLSFLYYCVSSDVIRAAVYISVVGISFIAFLYSRKRSDGSIRVNLTPLVLFYFLLLIGLGIGIINDNISPFILYLWAAPSLAYFIYNSRFNLYILSLPLYIISVILFVYFLLNKTMIGVFPAMSANYVSVVMIMNVVLLNAIERRQREKIRIHYSVLALFLSVLALGRAGMICSLLLLFNASWINWRPLSKGKKISALVILISSTLFFVVVQWDVLFSYFIKLGFFEKFMADGIDSPSRDILKRAYFDNINLRTFFTGYNYEDNHWFKHYGLNPHNSYIRLHHYLGMLFFIIIPIIIVAAIKLAWKNKFMFILLLAILLRAWTDSVLFLSLYDFVLVFLIFVAFEMGTVKSYNYKI